MGLDPVGDGDIQRPGLSDHLLQQGVQAGIAFPAGAGSGVRLLGKGNCVDHFGASFIKRSYFLLYLPAAPR